MADNDDDEIPVLVDYDDEGDYPVAGMAHPDRPVPLKEDRGNYPTAEKATTIEQEKWYAMNSSNVDRIRYHKPSQTLQVVFKGGTAYEYDGVEPQVFMAFLRTHSPGQFVHYVLIAYGYSYRKIGAGFSTSPPRAPRFDDMPFLVPDIVQQVNAGKRDDGPAPQARGSSPPPSSFEG